MKKRSRREGSSLVEFAAVLFVFFLLLFPLINMISLICGAVGAYLVTRQASIVAANSTTFSNALSNVPTEADTLVKTCLAFTGLKPVGGISGKGVDLFITKTSMIDDSVEVYGPNTAVPGALDLADGVYEYEAVSTFDVAPYLNLRGLPWIGTVPGLGAPVRLRFQNVRACEHPEGIGGPGTLLTTFSHFGPPGTTTTGGTNTIPFEGVGNVSEGGRRLIFTSQIASDDPNNPGMYSMQLIFNRRHGDDIFSYRGYFTSQSTGGAQVGMDSQYTLHDHRGQEFTAVDNPFAAINLSHVSMNGANSILENAVMNRLQNSIENSRQMSDPQKNALQQALTQMQNWAMVNHYR